MTQPTSSHQRLHDLDALRAAAMLIGVVAALLPSGAPLGFVAILGVLALIGILIRNSVILVVQIDTLRKAGKHAWDAVQEATEHRMRPIMLTAAAAAGIAQDDDGVHATGTQGRRSLGRACLVVHLDAGEQFGFCFVRSQDGYEFEQ